ncbi:MAG: FtsW/RodA/SpoVE family cell cycle protein, partial [Gammaproteobacteria bacterium]|nr:FtsW/RodA/SpoVE family cell cycle protein [Gammaproteobacteria bacterium]
SGGIYGKGWLNGTQSHLEFLPERSTDFIFAVYCEEFGLMGVLLLLTIYLFIVARGLYIAMNAQQAYGKLLAAALTLTFFVYVFVNMGMVIGQLPVVGVPLPLISHGGTSMVTLMLAFGILMSIQTHRRILSD